MTEQAARKRKRRIRGNWVAVTLLLLLVLVMGGANLTATLLDVHSEDRHNAQVYSTNVSTCQSGNMSRSQQAGLWDYVLTLLTPPRTATAQQKQGAALVIGKLRRRVGQTFTPRDCTALYQQKG